MPLDRQIASSSFSWRRVTEADFGLLSQWLARPHVARWWNHETALEAVARDFGAAARGEEPSEDLLVSLDGGPLGLVQRSRLDDYPEYRGEIAAIVPVPAGCLTLDYFIADPDETGHGVGTAMLRTLLMRSWQDHPGASAVVIAVVAANTASWRALEKAGFHRVAEGDIAPDNPVDDPLHYIYRSDRPPAV